MQIYKLAKELNIEPDKIIGYLNTHGHAINRPDAELPEDLVQKITKKLKKPKKIKKTGTKKKILIKLKKGTGRKKIQIKKTGDKKKLKIQKSDETKAKKEAILKLARKTAIEKEVKKKKGEEKAAEDKSGVKSEKRGKSQAAGTKADSWKKKKMTSYIII